MKNKTLVYVAIAGVIALGAYAYMNNKPKTETVTTDTPTTAYPTTTATTGTPTEKTIAESVVVQLTAQNSSGENGTATLTTEGGKTKVVIDLTGTPKTAQPSHIHLGACPNPAAVKYPLTNVVNGKSTTMIDTTLAQLKLSLPLAINVHKSAQESSVYVACGDIKL